MAYKYTIYAVTEQEDGTVVQSARFDSDKMEIQISDNMATIYVLGDWTVDIEEVGEDNDY